MKNMTLANIVKACQGVYKGDPVLLDREAMGISIDSRRIGRDFLFVATKGRRVDGHTFLPEIFRKGALCAVCEEEPVQVQGPYILVNSSFQALKELAEFYRQQLDVRVIGITGSVGKTSTKEMTASVLSQRFHTLKTEGNFNNEVGLPLTVFNLTAEHEAAVLEMGISDFGEMHRLSRIARPDICVITNIGQCHLENLKTRDGILKAKSEIFDYLKPTGRIILNGDDDKLSSLSEIKGIRPVFYGIGGGRRSLDVTADHIENLGLKGTGLRICAGHREFDVHIPLPGEHMVLNALAAAAAGMEMGLEPDEIREGIEAVKPLEGRSHLIETGRLTVLDDCYNANPVSMKASLDLLAAAKGRKVAVLGDMAELGERANELHAGIGAYAAGRGIDLLIGAGKLAKDFCEGASMQGGGIQVEYFSDADALLRDLPDLLRQDDTVLVKASHSMGFHRIVEKLTT